MNIRRCLIVGALLVPIPGAAQVLEKQELRDSPNLIQGEQRAERKVKIGTGREVRAVIEVTAKGNGTLSVANLTLRVYDAHDDGAVYANDMADVEFVDLDGDGFKDLIVTGAVEYHGEKDSRLEKVEPFTFIYLFDAKSESFKLRYKHARFALEDGPTVSDARNGTDHGN